MILNYIKCIKINKVMEKSTDEMISSIKKDFFECNGLYFSSIIGIPDVFYCNIVSSDVGYTLTISHTNYNNKQWKKKSMDLYSYNNTNLDNVLLHFHNLIQDGGKFLYSNIMDKIYMDKNKLIKDELYVIMRNKFLKIQMKVCVECHEICGVKTFCKHPLCRKCFESIRNKDKEVKCSQCGEILYGGYKGSKNKKI